MSYRDRPRIWRTAAYLIADTGASAVSLGSTGGGVRKDMHPWLCWAIDLRALVPDNTLPQIDAHYGTESNDYQRIPHRLKPHLKKLWAIANKRGLYDYGLYVVEKIYED